MARLPPPVPPPRRSSVARSISPSLAPVAFNVAPVDDEASLAKTIERRPASNAARVMQARIEACILQARLTLTELLRDPRGAIGAAVWTACVVAGVTGVLLGHARPSHAHATATATTSVAVHEAGALHDSVVLEAREEITEPPVLASGKEIAVDDAAPASVTSDSPRSAAARPQRRSGFGHLGADRVASGVARRSAPRRH